MVKKQRMPQLLVDEVILLVDTYFQLKSIECSSVKKDIIQELSESMRALPFFPDLSENPAFRSYAGMNMCLLNVAFIDPETKSKFGHGSVLQQRVFNYYVNKTELLHSIAKSIKEISNCKTPLNPYYSDNIVGKLLPSYHEYLEHTDNVVNNAKKMAAINMRSTCTVCGKDLLNLYGDYAYELIEAHISLPIASLNGRQRITSSDILFLCPTCHKLAHQLPELYEEDELRKLVKG